MKVILGSFFMLSICLSLLNVPAVTQPTTSQGNSPFLDVRSQGGELLTQAQNNFKAEADRFLEQGKELFEEDGYGSTGYNESELEAILPSLQRALFIYREIGDRRGERTTLYYLGTTYFHLGYSLKSSRKGFDYYQQSWAIDQKIGNPPNDVLIAEAQQFLYLGSMLFEMSFEGGGDGSKNDEDSIKFKEVSLPLLQKALTTFHALEDRQSESQTLRSLARLSFFLGEFPKAIEYSQKLRNIDSGYHSIEDSYYIEGKSYLNLGNYEQAKEMFQQSLNRAKKHKDSHMERESLSKLGDVYYLKENYTKAVDYYRQISDLRRIGSALFQSGDFAEAEKIIRSFIKTEEGYEFAFDNFEGFTGDAHLINMSSFDIFEYELLQKILVAQNKPNAALEIAERGRSRALIKLLSQRLFDKSATQLNIATPNLQQLQKIAKEQNATLVEYSIIIDEKTYILGFPEQRELFVWIIKPTGAVAFRRVDLKPLVQQQENPFNSLWQENLVGWSHTTTIAILVLAIGSLISLAIWRGQLIWVPRIVQMSQSQRRQLASCLLLAIGCSSTIIFASTPNPLPLEYRSSQTYSQQQTDSALAALVYSTHEAIGVRGSKEKDTTPKVNSNYQQTLQQNYKLLIQPIADLLPTKPNARVIFIPQLELSFVPFSALQDPDGKYLIEKHAISIAPSIQTLELTHQRRQELATGYDKLLQTQDALVVGNPTMPKVGTVFGEPPEQLEPLPGAEKEAKAIAKLLNTQDFIGSQATETRIVSQMPQARFIHLATHGLLDTFRSDSHGDGFPGAIALAPSSRSAVLFPTGGSNDVPSTQDDGWLTAGEILTLKLNAELVVLSACDTGQGRITGDGVIGLSRSLFTAGVPSVVASLWKVPDEPTAFLMTNFYKNLQQETDKAQALRQAMLTTMKEYPNPRNWAAFTLIGEAE